MTGQPLSDEREQEIRALTAEREWDESEELLAEIDRLRAEVARLEAELFAVRHNKREAEKQVARLEAALALANENIRLSETSQIPVIPRGAQKKIERLEAALAYAEERLDFVADWKSIQKMHEIRRGGGREQP